MEGAIATEKTEQANTRICHSIIIGDAKCTIKISPQSVGMSLPISSD
jgi:hypothetical protein